MTSTMHDLVVGLDGSDESAGALRWAVGAVVPQGRIHAVHALSPARELAGDAVLADSVAHRHRAERELAERWVTAVDHAGVDVVPRVVEGAVAATLLGVAREVGAAAVAVGHRPRARFGPRVVGHVTADLIHHARLPVVVVPDGWEPSGREDTPIVAGVGVAKASREALRWAVRQATAQRRPLGIVHAYGPRSLFRPDGLLDVLAYHLDPKVLPTWVEEDLLALAGRIGTETGGDVDVAVSVLPGRIGARLVEAGHDAELLVIGRGDDPFHRHAMAPYLRHALVRAPCPIVVVPTGGEV